PAKCCQDWRHQSVLTPSPSSSCRAGRRFVHRTDADYLHYEKQARQHLCLIVQSRSCWSIRRWSFLKFELASILMSEIRVFIFDGPDCMLDQIDLHMRSVAKKWTINSARRESRLVARSVLVRRPM